MKHWHSIIEHIERSTGQRFSVDRQQSVGGGSVSSAFTLSDDSGRQYFVKTNNTGRQAMFEAEAKGLVEISTCHCIKVPVVICFGDDGTQSYIVLEYLDMSGRADQIVLGEQLAAMHGVTAEKFGWAIDNTIGVTPQQNRASDNWLEFWRECRLGFQLQLAAENGYGGELQSLGERLMVEMPKLFIGRTIEASMLHGDLWAGNVAGLNDGTNNGANSGTPVIFDPAFYYGDRESDLAMTHVFGGFSADFYASYQNAFPLDEGFTVRKTFYNLYHIINHLNMFGGGYHAQAITMFKQVLSEIV